MYANSPEELLDESLRPATKLEKLSPADRLFGWTPQGQGSDGGYKSRIRVVCADGECPTTLKDFKNDPLPLAILGQPKPEQGRFYVAADSNGTPQDGVSKQDAGYDKDGKKELRGRKHYWHHKGREADKDNPNDYWDPCPSQDRNREYIRTGRIEDPQNRSINGWIEPGNRFEATLYLQNLQPEELGALLWLLSLPDKHYLKMGYGKPLGFGSVRIEIDTARLVNCCIPVGTGDDWKKYYAAFNDCPPATLNANRRKNCIRTFQDSMEAAYNTYQSFDKLPFISDFLQVMQGPIGDARIHYPRLDPTPDPEGKNYAWFMANERGRPRREAGRNEVGKQLALPDVYDKDGLPYIPTDPKP